MLPCSRHLAAWGLYRQYPSNPSLLIWPARRGGANCYMFNVGVRAGNSHHTISECRTSHPVLQAGAVEEVHAARLRYLAQALTYLSTQALASIACIRCPPHRLLRNLPDLCVNRHPCACAKLQSPACVLLVHACNNMHA